MGSIAPSITNFFLSNTLTSKVIKNTLGFASKRSIPLLQKNTLKKWINLNSKQNPNTAKKEVVLFIDEFTNFNDTEIGIKTIRLLNKLNYKVSIVSHAESGRTYLSKGLLRKAKTLAIKNVVALKDIINEQKPLLGIEPSAILTFRDEYPDLVGSELKEAAIKLAKNSLLVEEFIANEFDAGQIDQSLFTLEEKQIKLHGHCQQKAVASTACTKKVLAIPKNYTVSEIPSGCCGMAGSFGYEKEHYEISMKIGELVLFPEVRKAPNESLIAAPGTSCRHQIFDGTGKTALHPVEILFEALN